MKAYILGTLCLLLASPGFTQVDADTFFLLDTEKGCISAEHLDIDHHKAYKQPPAVFEEGQFVVFQNDPNRQSDINNLTTLKQKVDAFFDQDHKNMAQAYQDQLMSQVTPKVLIQVLKSVLEDDSLLNEIAKNSYIHVMGFTKIVLLTGPNDKGYKVRLHLWWPEQAGDTTKLVLEDKHVHKWDFASKMFSGSFEDQLYLVNAPRKDEVMHYQEFLQALNKLPEQEQKKIFDSINVIEMSMYGQTMFQQDKFRCNIDKEQIYSKKEIMDKFDLNEKEFIDIISIHESYITQPNITGKYGLEKNGVKHLSFPVIYRISEGQSYYQHHTLAHRLISDPDEMVATFIITGAPIDEIEPYILMRSQEGEDITKVAPILDKSKLVLQLKNFIKHLESKMNLEDKQTTTH